MFKCFSSFQLFWDAVSKMAKAGNHPAFHPCCGTWTTRLSARSHISHVSSVKWRQIFSHPDAKETTQKEYLHAHMKENGWGLPIRINYPCTVFTARSQGLQQPENRPPPDGEFARYQSASPHINHLQPLSPVPPTFEAPTPIRFPSEKLEVRHPAGLQPIQIIMNPTRPVPIQSDVLYKINQINYRTEASLHVGNINSGEIKDLSNFCHSSLEPPRRSSTKCRQS